MKNPSAKDAHSIKSAKDAHSVKSEKDTHSVHFISFMHFQNFIQHISCIYLIHVFTQPPYVHFHPILLVDIKEAHQNPSKNCADFLVQLSAQTRSGSGPLVQGMK